MKENTLSEEKESIDIIKIMEKETEYMYQIQNEISESMLILRDRYDITENTLSLKIKTLKPDTISKIFKNPNYDYGVSIGELEALNSFINSLLELLDTKIETKIIY